MPRPGLPKPWLGPCPSSRPFLGRLVCSTCRCTLPIPPLPAPAFHCPLARAALYRDLVALPICRYLSVQSSLILPVCPARCFRPRMPPLPAALGCATHRICSLAAPPMGLCPSTPPSSGSTAFSAPLLSVDPAAFRPTIPPCLMLHVILGACYCD
ncbi:hypothetical protein B0H19DRAFT_1111304 [Mycena capillaripes]|nr:hypothetical protein B0H19DRAFT_1111304 [Mycena capillaripes]